MRTFLALAVAGAAIASAYGTPKPSYGNEYSPVPASCSHLPPHQRLINQTYVLPDPFHFINGHPVRNEADWYCRAAQIRELFQKYELGYKPAKPPIFSSTYSNNTLNITAGLSKSKTINFSIPIKPANVTSNGASPAVIAYNGVSVPITAQAATIVLNVDQIALQDNSSSRGIGLFYDLYGNDTTRAGALMAWAWAVSRILDALEAHPEAGINPRKVAVTGCSRNGKGAMVAGAFDERIALTIPQESGSGGDACWRTSRDMLVNQNLATQTAQEIVTENVWFSESFDYFARDNYTVGLLPVDHHELAGLVAPRGLYSTNNVGFLWLGDWSTLECMTAANTIFQALGVADHQGFSQDGPHNHCSFPPDQEAEIAAFYNRFLLDEAVSTDVFRTVDNWTFDPKWTPWAVPDLVA
ncbi:carbohydrate-binding module 1 [Elasticomyces elasticus]|nr:carbohydrate-binding module 1 [Elasticomyces elasticus]KAK3635746.1 carbohydrate-binding module 1 [Elasticomyces elasticus]KAK4911905.1 carbohydrate-binding module 1 [Elasticomyces elasticus]KAK5740442.1 carbohydrate-binding module 1 [Elasticomyces elasticus]